MYCVVQEIQYSELVYCISLFQCICSGNIVLVYYMSLSAGLQSVVIQCNETGLLRGWC